MYELGIKLTIIVFDIHNNKNTLKKSSNFVTSKTGGGITGAHGLAFVFIKFLIFKTFQFNIPNFLYICNF